MVRSVGIMALVLGLAWTGLATAQSSAPTAAPPRERFITVHEEGSSPQRCKLLRAWRQPNGCPVFQVQAVDTGELMTIVGSAPPGGSGDPREMSTRIFRWGSDNKPPAGAPMPPPTALTKTPPPAAPPQARLPLGQARMSVQAPQAKPVIAPPAAPAASSVSSPLLSAARPVPATLTSRKSEVAPPAPLALPTPPPPANSLPAVTAGKPGALPNAAQPKPVVAGNPQSMTPMSTPVIQQPLVRTPPSHDCTSSAPAQPRLLPSPSGTVVGAVPGPCPGPAPCDTCCQTCQPCPTCKKPWQLCLPCKPLCQPCQPCNPSCPVCSQPCPSCQPCDQPSCVCCTTSPMRQSFLSRLFKPHPTCECTEVVCQPSPPSSPAPAPTPAPAAIVAKPPMPLAPKVVTETAKPRDWRESWGKVEPWSATAQAAPAKPVETSTQQPTPTPPAKPVETLTQRVAPAPVKLEPSSDPDPIKAPEMYRDMAMSTRPSNSKIPVENEPAPAPPKKTGLFGLRRHVEPQPPLSPYQPSAAPEPPATAQATPSVASPIRAPGRVVQLPADEANAFWSPPEKPKVKYNTAEGEQDRPPASRVSPRIAPGYAGPLPPPGPMQPGMPMMPFSPDSGVPDALGNAFTLPGTRRPIPADFGPTPQEPNGFDPAVRMGQGSPPQGYSMGMAAMPRPPMQNMMAMGPCPPMMGNPYMSVPPAPMMPGPVAAAPPPGVPQLLAKLKDSLYPSDRESAAEQLSELSGRGQPVVVQHLMKAAREDPAATVRAACVHALTHMKANTPEVTTLARELKSDRDPRVRQEAEEALHALGDSGIQQASHR